MPLEKVRNPNWTRDELILALDLYLKHRGAIPGKTSVEVVQLSALLNTLGQTRSRGGTFRNESGVYMKLMNFRSIDPDYTSQGKVGLTRNNKDEKVVWDLFAQNRPYLESVVANLCETATIELTTTGADDADEDDIEDCEEGRILTRQHRYRERNKEIVTRFKAQCKKKAGGVLHCAGCGLDYAKKYGAMGERLIDVHHTKPVHTLLPSEKTSVKDLVLLCVSCHRAVHSEKKWLSIDELRVRLLKQAASVT